MSQAEREVVAELTRQLYRPIERGNYIHQEWAPTAEVAARLAATGSVHALSNLVRLVGEPACRDIASTAVRDIMTEADPVQLPTADRFSRWAWVGTSATWSRRRRELRRQIKAAANPIGAAVAATMDPDGFVRQQAVRLLWEVTSEDRGVAMAATLLRTNDWVDEVSREACGLVRAHIGSLTDAEAVGCLPLIDRLGDVERITDDELHAWALASIRDGHAGGLPDGVTHHHRSVRRSCLQLAIAEDDELSVAAVDRTLSTAHDVVMRTRAAHRLMEGDPGGAQLERLRLDAVAAVRLLAYRRLLAGDITDVDLLRAALADPAVGVRTLAQYRARTTGAVDAHEFYLAELQASGSRVAIAGLGETGVPEDAEVLCPLVSADNGPSVRRVAMGAIGQLDPEGQSHVLVEALSDPSRKVARTARRALQRSGAHITRATFHMILGWVSDPKALKSVAAAIDLLPRWDHLEAALGMLPGVGPDVRDLLLQHIGSWTSGYGRTWATTPSAMQLQSASTAVDACRELPDATRDQVRFLLTRLER